MSIQTEITACVVATVTTDLDYVYVAKVCDDEISLNLIDTEEDSVLGTVTFGSIDEMRAVADALLKLANVVSLK